MTTNSDMDRLLELGAAAKEFAPWEDFSRYCEYRGRGIRSLAMKTAESFVTQASAWPFEQRLAFVRWVVPRSRRFSNWRLLFPHPLHTGLIEPVLLEWEERSPDSAESHMWLGLLHCSNAWTHLVLALELDPKCNLVRERLVQGILEGIWHNQHEMPWLYIHDPSVDLKDLDYAAELCDGAECQEWAAQMRSRIAKQRKVAESWLEKHPRDGEFASH